jgi:hypothetical protein
LQTRLNTELCKTKAHECDINVKCEDVGIDCNNMV